MSWTGNNPSGRSGRGRGGIRPMPQWPDMQRQDQGQNSRSHEQPAVSQNQGRNQPNNRPPPPTNTMGTRASFSTRRLFPATSAAEDRNHPDDLINEIPFHEKAVAEFNSNTPDVPPFRDIPSNIIAGLSNPVPGSEPDWRAMIIGHFPTANAIRPVSNLQDLYLWATRVGIPNAVIDNRRFLLHYFLRNPHASMKLSLRYDAMPSADTYVPLYHEPQASPQNTVQNHSVFRDYSTPDGARFTQWMTTPIHVPVAYDLPSQMQHRRSFLDGFFAEDEAAVRQLAPVALIDRTVGVLRLFWELWMRNRELKRLQDRVWEGIEDETSAEIERLLLEN